MGQRLHAVNIMHTSVRFATTLRHCYYMEDVFLQQYAVDNYVKMESHKLRWIRQNQLAIWAEQYQGLQDAFQAGENEADNVGRRTILPSSFVGSPRDMVQRFQDAMSLVQKFGKPDLFITMTCNPGWDEIRNELLPGQIAQDRPDLLTRVFKSKFEQFKHDVVNIGVFGTVIAYVYVFEFQKRGLPHVHMLLIIDENDKLRNPDDYDQIVRAEIPAKEEQPQLHCAVLKHMIHGPCGIQNPRSPCMKNGKCKKGYPKPFSLETYQVATAASEQISAIPRIIQDEINIPVVDEEINFLDKLNHDQRVAYNTIMGVIERKESMIFFVDGPGGTGKTFLYRTLLANLRKLGHIAIATATSGIAATLLPGGRTAHSRFKIPLTPDASSTCSISIQSDLAELIRRATVVVWDEAPMVNRRAVEAFDRTLKDIMEVDSPFGGKVVIFGGDFRQVLPVVPNGTRSEMIDACIVKSPLWRYVKVLHLKYNMRTINDEHFAEYVRRIGDGNEPFTKDDLVKVPSSMAIQWEGEHSVYNLIEEVFPDLHNHASDAKYMVDRALLTPINDDVDKLNAKIISQFPGEEVTLHSFDEVEEDTQHLYQQEFLNSISPRRFTATYIKVEKRCPNNVVTKYRSKSGTYVMEQD
uniref:ATP-dependent DNA helicase n=1 Tax=Fagus sylvatica TaxID=28930 RepID=A0A2N9INS4_FAGSY